MAGGRRHRARVAALQTLYETDSSTHKAATALDKIAKDDRLPQESKAFARTLIEGVLAQQDELDAIIGKAAPAWPVDQLSPVDRNILRLAICEMLGDNGAPVRAVINEAVELAKSFGSENSARFINGVLGSIERQRHELLASLQASKGGD
jgi:N utilization substance protein B